MSTEQVAIVGANAAGMSAAHQALRGARARGRNLEVVVLERTHDTSYSACGIPYWLAGDVASSDQLVARTARQHAEMGVDLRLGCEVTALDLDRQLLAYADGGGAHELGFDQVMLATGARPVIPPWAVGDGGLIPGVHALSTLDDGRTWLDLLDRRPQRALVVGSGYIGLEMTEALLERGVEVTLVTRSVVMSSLEPDLSRRVEQSLRAAGVDVRLHTQVIGAEPGGASGSVVVTASHGATLSADVVLVSTGIRPDHRLGADAGLETGDSGGYLPDPEGRLAPGVWSAGDCCELVHRLTGKRTFAPLGTHANKLGRIVGENLSGGALAFGGVLGTAITRFAGGNATLEIAKTGLGTSAAEAAGFAPIALVTEGTTTSGYMPEANPIATTVVADAHTRALIGVQIVGGAGSAKRIDTAAAALWGGLSVDDLAWMDLAYAPPFATAWDALSIAARRVAESF